MMPRVTYAHHPADAPNGRKDRPKSPPEHLAVDTGQLDDQRRVLDARKDRLWVVALTAWEEQDSWSPREHELFWTGLLPAWPRKHGAEPVQGHQRIYAAMLAEDGLSRSEIAEAMGIEEDSLRREKTIERGLAHVEALDMEYWQRRWGISDWARRRVAEGPLLPRVWAAGEEDAPSGGRVNAVDFTKPTRERAWQYVQRALAGRR